MQVRLSLPFVFLPCDRRHAAGETEVNGTPHYPSHPSRLQFGIWDASSPAGTCEWARGPIDWESAPGRMSAVFEGIEVECPY